MSHVEDLRAWLATPTDSHAGWQSILRRIGKLCGRPDVEARGALDANTQEGSYALIAGQALPRAGDDELSERRWKGVPRVRSAWEATEEAKAGRIEWEAYTAKSGGSAEGLFWVAAILTAAIAVVAILFATTGSPGTQTYEEPIRSATDTFGRSASGQPDEFAPTSVTSLEFDECGGAHWCPRMVIIPAGTFVMGSPNAEAGRGDDEGPQRRVTIRAFAVSKFEITRGQYAQFAEATNRSNDVDCRTFRTREGYSYDGEATWNDPRFRQSENHPVVCVDWFDASAYVEWLNTRVEGASYRLLTEAEWEYVARAGSTTPYPWGAEPQGGCGYENAHDETSLVQYPDWPSLNCRDGFVHTAPVGLFHPNAFGLYDVMGNVSEWVQDCYTRVAYGDVRNSENEVIDAIEGGLGARVAGRGGGSYVGYPVDGSPYEFPDCDEGVFRGGGWDAEPTMLRSALRRSYLRGVAYSNVGFRVAKTLSDGAP